MVDNSDTGFSYYGMRTLDDYTWSLIQDAIYDPTLKWEKSKIYLDKNDTKGLVIVKDIPKNISKINQNNYETIVEDRIRSSEHTFLKQNERLRLALEKMFIEYINKISGWNYSIFGIESIQLTHYKKDNFYDWHLDEHAEPVIENDKLVNRKVSVTIWLNDPDEYEGGEFDIEVRGPNYEDKKRYDTFKMPKKSMIIFPSNKWHRVRPITSGVRKSLVMWLVGPPFI
tara:strand:+ start:69 stop:749 length:681 start_codon:yes stop_codon:yes gene_type:complete